MEEVKGKLDEIIWQMLETNKILHEMEKRLPAKPRFEREVEAVKKLSRIRAFINEVYANPTYERFEIMHKIQGML